MSCQVKPHTFLNRDVIKAIAVSAMLMNHIGKIFLPQLSLQNRGFLFFCESIGSFTAITMVFFLVEGFHRTHSKKKYLSRLILFAILSQIPYMLAFGRKALRSGCFNMIFTLCICFGILYVCEKAGNLTLKTGLILAGIFLCGFCDWSWLAPVFTLLFAWAWKSEKRKRSAFLLAMLIYGADLFLEYYTQNCKDIAIQDSFLPCFSHALALLPGMFLASCCLIFFYNGRQTEKGRKFSKYFFYIFYPGHLLILGILRILFT